MKTSFLFLKSSDSSTLNIDSINQRRDEIRLIGSSVAGEIANDAGSVIKVIRKQNLIEQKKSTWVWRRRKRIGRARDKRRSKNDMVDEWEGMIRSATQWSEQWSQSHHFLHFSLLLTHTAKCNSKMLARDLPKTLLLLLYIMLVFYIWVKCLKWNDSVWLINTMNLW